jgi:solute carrier family 12 sodium/potassium/chloride transporter 2
MYIVGFAETVRDLLREYSITILDGDLNDVRIIGLATCICLMGVVFVGTSFESKMQMGLLVILTLSILDYFMGSVMPPNHEQRLRGVTGYSCKWITFQFLHFACIGS